MILHVALALGSVIIYLWAVFSLVLLVVALLPIGGMRTSEAPRADSGDWRSRLDMASKNMAGLAGRWFQLATGQQAPLVGF